MFHGFSVSGDGDWGLEATYEEQGVDGVKQRLSDWAHCKIYRSALVKLFSPPRIGLFGFTAITMTARR